MDWTRIDEMWLKRYTVAVVCGDMSLEEVPEKYREEVRTRVLAWFEEKAKAEALATEQVESV